MNPVARRALQAPTNHAAGNPCPDHGDALPISPASRGDAKEQRQGEVSVSAHLSVPISIFIYLYLSLSTHTHTISQLSRYAYTRVYTDICNYVQREREREREALDSMKLERFYGFLAHSP